MMPEDLKNMNTTIVHHERNRQHWLWGVGIVIVLLNLYTFIPSYGQAITPTPHIGTVPLFTPTHTPTPLSTALPSATPVPVEPTSTPDVAPTTPANNGDGGAVAPPSVAPIVNNPPAANTQSDITLTAVVTSTTLNMRRGPAATERVVDTLFLNDKVQVIARNGEGSWWLVCCGTRTRQPGWVSAAYLRPDFALSDLLKLVPLAPGLSTTAATTSTLQLEMSSSPVQIWQGLEVELRLVVTNSGKSPAKSVRLRDHLPAALIFQQARSDASALIRHQQADNGGTVVSAEWPQLAAGEQVTLTLTVQVDSAIADGELVDNLAIVNVDGGANVTAGITLAMPPALLPQFR